MVKTKKTKNWNHRITASLNSFWRHIEYRPSWIHCDLYGLWTCKKRHYTPVLNKNYCKGPDDVMKKLCQYARRDRTMKDFCPGTRRQEIEECRDELRDSFNETKWSRFPLRNEVCLVCGVPAQVRHHIILLTHGGVNWLTNLAPLCNVCHAEIHPWLKYG